MDYLWLSERLRLRSGAGRHCPASPMLSEGEADGYRPEQEPTFVQPHPSTFSHPSCPERLEPERRMLEKIQKMLVVRSPTIRELLAEALGMYILMVFGLSSVAQVVLGKGEFGQYVSINLAFGIGVTLGIHAAGGISGAHLNAAITIMHCILGNLPWRKLPAYLLGQFLGSFLAAATVFGTYYDILYDYSKGNFTVTGPTATASIFSTYPHPCMSLLGGFFTEFMATVMLILGILVIHDEKNNAALKGTQAMLTGILVLGIGMGMGMTTGYAINPSRDLPPRIFTAIAGWGVDVFTAGNYWWWIPVVAPILGSLVGSLVYKLFVDIHNQSVPESGNEKGQPAIETSTL
ncbi:aquaporin-7-like [Aythya fuligula]|uniref:Aquaporin-7-like n=1 Tax=Aythya fuligula TaxID=219594 RepID=A0A6J3EHK9_AYTFU|nr:aquaporin-7-like [Aythya fuligula]